MRHVGLIPRKRLRHIPYDLRVVHEYCFFLHDECVRILKEYENAEAHLVTVQFPSKLASDEFQKLASTDPIEALRAAGHPNEAKRVILNQITMRLTSDCLHHIFEGLSCLEKRKVIVALNLLRKPFKDNLIYLAWILGDEDEFFHVFTSGNPEKLAQKQVGNIRTSIFSKALAKTEIGSWMDADLLNELIYNRKSDWSLEKLFQRAVHLITIANVELRTEPENFNFIFKDPRDNDVYERIYDNAPYILLFLTHVILELFDRMRNMDEGSRLSTITRTILGFTLLTSEDTTSVQDKLKNMLGNEVKCEYCHSQLSVTRYNAIRILITESFRCTSCGKNNAFPFSWLF
jgi:hypothetical protein